MQEGVNKERNEQSTQPHALVLLLKVQTEISRSIGTSLVPRLFMLTTGEPYLITGV